MERKHVIAICDYSHAIMHQPDLLPSLDVVIREISDAIFNDEKSVGNEILDIISCDTEDYDSDVPNVIFRTYDGNMEQSDHPSYSDQFKGNLPICNGIRKCCSVMKRHPCDDYVIFMIVSNVPSDFDSFQLVMDGALNSCSQFKNAKRILINLSYADVVFEFYRIFPTCSPGVKLQAYVPSDNIDYGDVIFG